MRLVGPALGDDVDDRTATPTEFSPIIVSQNLELLQRIGRRGSHGGTEEGFVVIGAV